MKTWYLGFVLLLSISGLVRSQTLDELNKYRIAQALEGAGEYGRAVDFYQELHEISPRNIVYFDGLRRCYMQLKRYDEAVKLIKDRINIEPSNIVLYGELGDALYKYGRPDSALTVWRNAILINKNNPEAYRTVARFMSESRLFDKAIEVLKEGELTTNSPLIFAPEIARLYILTTNYRSALSELLKILEVQDHASALAYIESQIGLYSSSSEAMSQFTVELEKRSNDAPDNVDIKRLLAFIYMETRNYASAYKIYKWLDVKSQNRGTELMAFANQAYNDEAYEASARAYKEVALSANQGLIIPSALIGYANSLQKLSTSANKNREGGCVSVDSVSLLSEAVAVYENVAMKYPGTEYANEAILNAVKIRMNYFDDVQGARKLLSNLSGNLNQRFKNEEHLLKLEIGIREANYDSVIVAGESLIDNSPFLPQSLIDQVKFYVALSFFYRGQLDSAAALFATISSNPMSDVANEALNYLAIIKDNSSAPEAVIQYARAAGMIKSGRVPEGISTLEGILKIFPNALIVDNTRLMLAEAYCQIGDLTNSIKFYREMASDSTGIFSDLAQYRLGVIYEERLKDSGKALKEYENFLRRFPASIYQDRVRMKIIGLMAHKKEATG